MRDGGGIEGGGGGRRGGKVYLVQHVCAISRGEHNDARVVCHSVHLDEQLIECVLRLAATECSTRAVTYHQ